MKGDVWRPLFPLGRVYATPGAMEELERRNLSPRSFLARHISGDWGALCVEDQEANRKAVASGDRILSSYSLDDTQKLWIITESDRSATMLLLPQEY